MNLIVSWNQRGWLGRAALLALALFAPAALATNLVAHWKLDESNAPYADFGSNGVALNHDAATTTPFLVPGYNDGAAQLRWQNPPGVATRLHASGGKLQTDSFGFSFWFNARLSWQVLISGGQRFGRGPAGVGRARQQSRAANGFMSRAPQNDVRRDI